MKKQMMFKTKGMNLDLSVSAFNPEFAFENMNLRLSTNEGNTTMSWVNERGTSLMSIIINTKPDIKGDERLWTTDSLRREANEEAYEEIQSIIEKLQWIEAQLNDQYYETTLQLWEAQEGHTLLWFEDRLHTLLEDLDSQINFDLLGTDRYIATEIKGIPIGTAVINHQLVLFTTSDFLESHMIGKEDYIIHTGKDRIYVISKFDEEVLSNGIDETFLEDTNTTFNLLGKLLCELDLNFDVCHPIETIVSYESNAIQKVYWTDGKNQPRMINIAKNITEPYKSFSFDFIGELQLNEEVTVLKIVGGNGAFPAGVIQYAFTYYLMNGLESNIFYTTPLLYISPRDRGGRPDEKVDNVFKITIDKLDTNYEYLRIYSIIRTSLNSTPLCKRILDISIADAESYTDDNIEYKKATYTDTGYSGDSVDPTELLYKGGKSIIAQTLEQKDGTLFLGNLKILDSFNTLQTLGLENKITLELSTREFAGNLNTSGNYAYYNLLTSYKCYTNNGTTARTEESVPCAGFKRGNYYRFGVLFQDKTGRWSSPIFIKDEIITNTPSIEEVGSPAYHKVSVPTMKGTLSLSIIEDILGDGYKKVRGVVVYPEILDRVVMCLNVGNSIIRDANVNTKYQSSWFFRPKIKLDPTANVFTRANYKNSNNNGTVSPISQISDETLYIFNTDLSDPTYIRQVEILGHYTGDSLMIDTNSATLHSPDTQFNEEIINSDFSNTKYLIVGDVYFTKTLSEIELQTETPTINSGASGFIKKSFHSDYSYGIVAGPFYQDYILDDWSDKIAVAPESKSFVGWMVYPWLRTGSLNNDITRPANMGVLSALLKKKVISNYRYSKTSWRSSITSNIFADFPKLFYDDEVSIVKFDSSNYFGNIDTLLTPTEADGLYFNFKGSDTDGGGNPITNYLSTEGVNTPFTENDWWKTSAVKEADTTDPNIVNLNGKIKHWTNSTWGLVNYFNTIGDHYKEVCIGKYSVRMRYKSTPHLIARSATSVFDMTTTPSDRFTSVIKSALPIVEVVKPGDTNGEEYYRYTMFGGTSLDALKENIWIPCGEPVSLGDGGSDVEFEYSYGDTYFQRWDCMKTYPFTPEDLNQIIEIGSFMLETYMNIDGRYDRNRGLLINVSPLNYNLLNPVYTQRNNFFSYKYLQDTNPEKELYINLITWTKTKESGADVDLWTNITLASVLELDGDKGEINKLIRFNDLLLAFQDTGISLILYNESVQVSTENGIPVELANSGKVLGKRYLSDTIGCSNKWSMTVTSSGIYFIDNHDRSIYLFNEGLTNISLNGGMDSWCKNNITLTKGWNPRRFLLTGILSQEFVSYYDRNNKDVLFINSSTALAYSEKLGTFTSFYSYGGAPYLCTLDDLEIWINRDLTPKPSVDVPLYYLWQHQGSDKHCKMFEVDNPYYTILIGNPEPTVDKTFTNLDFRACVQGDGESLTNNGVTSFKNFYLPFDNIEVWNEYQHGISQLNMTKGRSLSIHNYINPLDAGDTPSPLSRKFRIWRCDIPRDNYPTGLDVKEYETAKGITRFKSRPLDRIRNPWVYIKLTKDVSETYLPKAEIHDVVLTYFD